MQVTQAGVVNLRHKKQRVNGTGWGPEPEDRERPMSWEGELSDTDEPPAGAAHKSRAPHSPMVVERDERASPVSLAATSNSVSHMLANSCGDKEGVLRTAPVSSSNHTVTPTVPYGGTNIAAFQERVSHNPSFGEVSTSGRPTVLGGGGAFQPPCSIYSESPVPTPRPTSSSSSRSSYSPTQSPLLGRGGPSFSHAHHSPVPQHRHCASSDGSSVYSPASSPLQGRHVPVVDGGSVYSPSQSPSQGRHRISDGMSPTAAHLRNLSVSRNAYAGGDQVGPPYPYVVMPDPALVQSTPDARSTASSASVASSASDESNASDLSSPTRRPSADGSSADSGAGADAGPGVSRQQLLSGPCPVCGDRISGFHYGIFSCESCKGFFKRTVQNKKHYVCLRGASCPVAISTRKKCPACRFDKCLRTGMKLEAIREDRTRGGRSTYQCSYSLPVQLLNDSRNPLDASACESNNEPIPLLQKDSRSTGSCSQAEMGHSSGSASSSPRPQPPTIPSLVQEIVSVEHLWHYTDREISRLSEQFDNKVSAASPAAPQVPELPAMDGSSNILSSLCNIADHRLYKIVKWCKSLPLFREIQVDDQIALLINSWCELLLLSCCYRSTGTPNEIRVSMGKSVTLGQARDLGMGPVIERMLALTDLLRRLQVDQREFVCLKVLILLTSDASGLKEPEKVRACKKQVLEALQAYTNSHYPSQPSKFGELLLCVPELERACQLSKESLAASRRIASAGATAAPSDDPQAPSFNLLVELLRGDH
uniref:Putative nuclear hormone receptor ftz-f1 beta n=1 Tax=Ornithodoros turicata TaxID=34597 RepID=A0A2R5L5J4_9ACAR